MAAIFDNSAMIIFARKLFFYDSKPIRQMRWMGNFNAIVSFNSFFYAFLVWSRAETSKLLQLYAENINNIGPMKSFRTKKMLFEYIATELNEEFHGEKSGDQANMKYKNVISVKKQQVSEKRRSGASGGRKIDFEDELAMIASLDDSIEPEILMGVDQIVRKQSEAGPKKPDQKPRRRKMDINETLDNFMEKFLEEKDKRAKEREEAKERRHQEKLSKIDQLLSLLKNQSEM
jgi:hypothetical protein